MTDIAQVFGFGPEWCMRTHWRAVLLYASAAGKEMAIVRGIRAAQWKIREPERDVDGDGAHIGKTRLGKVIRRGK